MWKSIRNPYERHREYIGKHRGNPQKIHGESIAKPWETMGMHMQFMGEPTWNPWESIGKPLEIQWKFISNTGCKLWEATGNP